MVEEIMYKIIESEMTTVWGNKVKYAHRLDTTDSMTAEAILKYDEYMAKEFTYSKDNVFIDIGSHIGTWGLLMASKDPSYQVYCFEALPENVEVIKRTALINELNNLHVYNFAVSDTSEGTERIYYTEGDSDFFKSHRFIGNAVGSNESKGSYVDVPKIGLDDIFSKMNIEHCRVMKLDCEGCELKGFASMKPETFDKIDIIVGEFHPNNVTAKSFFDIFKNKFKNVSNFNIDIEHEDMQDFAFLRKGVEL